jgi:hypothetical protein
MREYHELLAAMAKLSAKLSAHFSQSQTAARVHKRNVVLFDLFFVNQIQNRRLLHTQSKILSIPAVPLFPPADVALVR